MRLHILFPVFILLAGCHTPEQKQDADPGQPENAASVASGTPQIMYQLVHTYPHDPKAFTEGLQFADGVLYESTGEYGTSDLRTTDVQGGKVLKSVPLDKKYFGEGLTVLHDKIYQLTYRERIVFVYDRKSKKQLKIFPLPTLEGWGMTTNDTSLIYGDGSDKLYFMDPATFKETRRINVTDEQGPVQNINELEYIKGYLYANQWQTDYILKIDPATGHVVGRADLGDLRAKAGIPALGTSPDRSAPEVLNGIAYDAATNRIFITGKFWPYLFEVKLDN